MDANHAEIVSALRACGWHVHDCSRLGGGFPDLVAAKQGRMVLVEVKDGAKVPSKRVLTMAENEVFSAFAVAGVRVRVVTSVEDAVALV